MPFARAALLLFAVLATTAQAEHVVQFVNNCPFTLTPVYKGNHDSPSASRAAALSANGGRGRVTLPEIWASGRIFAQDPKSTCLEPDGARCTLFECNFGPADANGNKWNQCNISLVSGYNVPATFGYVGGAESSCSKTFSCKSPNCASTEAYLVGDGAASCSSCIAQCNTDGVGLKIEFCPAGSTIPDMGQKPAASSSSSPPKPSSSAPKPTSSSAKPTSAVTSEAPEPTSSSTPNDAPAFAGTSSISSEGLDAAPTPTPTAKRCARSRLERAASRMVKRGKVDVVGHHLRLNRVGGGGGGH